MLCQKKKKKKVARINDFHYPHKVLTQDLKFHYFILKVYNTVLTLLH